jgi:MerR family copper efflux transcriptional regulator
VWTIGEAAARAGVTRKAVRVYEANGLLPPPTRSPAGYRLFDDDDVDLLRFIRQARDLDLSVVQIADILNQTTPETLCQTVKNLARARIAQIEAHIALLAATRDRLTALLVEPTAREAPRSPDQACRCPLIEAAATGSGGR